MTVDVIHYTGQVHAVEERSAGDKTTLPYSAGQTALLLSDTSDFLENGGTCQIGGQTYTYISADHTTRVLTLSTGLLSDIDLGSSVFVYPFRLELVALVQTGNGQDAITALVPHSLYDKMASGIREVTERESVEIVIDRGTWKITDILGLPPITDGSYIDPETLPDVVPNSVPPSAPTGLGGSSVAFSDAQGQPRANFTLTWTDPTTNSDASPLTDLKELHVYSRLDAINAVWVLADIVAPGEEVSYFPVFEAAVWRRFSVIAVDSENNWSTRSSELRTQMAIDTTPPPTPSTPTTSVKLGTATIFWNGLDSTAAQMPVDLDHVRVHVSTTNNFTVGTGNYFDRLYASGAVVYTGATYGTPYYVKFVAYDKAGNASSVSAQATFTATALVSSDLSSGVAGSRVTILGVPPTVPTPVNGDVWIDTANGNIIKTREGGAWVARQDTAISTAQTTANGKNRVTWSTSVASGTVGFVPGDTWFRTDGSGVVIGQWEFFSGAWQPRTLGNLVIAAIDAGKITTGSLDANRIAADSIVTSKLAAGSVIAAKIASGAVETDKLAANAVTASKVDAGAITAEKISLGVLRRNLISDGSFEEDYALTEWAPSTTGHGNINQWRDVVDGTTPGLFPVRSMGVGRARSGRSAMSLTAGPTQSNYLISNCFPIKPGKEYRLIVNACSLTSIGTALVDVQVGATPTDIAGFDSVSLVGDSTWTLNPPLTTEPITPDSFTTYSWSFTAPAGKNFAALRTGNNNPVATSTIVIDDISVVEIGAGGASELTAAGLRIFDNDGYEVTALVANRRNFFSVQQEGVTLASISDTGKGSFTEVSIDGYDSNSDGLPDHGFEIYGTEFKDWLNKGPRGIVAYGIREDTGSYYGTVHTFLRLNKSLEVGREYRVHAEGFVGISASGARAWTKIWYTTNGTDALVGTTGTPLVFWRSPAAYAADAIYRYDMTASLRLTGTEGAMVPVSLALGMDSEVSGNSRVYANVGEYRTEIWVEDLGPTAADTSVNVNGGTTPPATEQEYVTTWTSTTGRCYMGDGAQDGSQGVSDMKQGYSSADGDSKSLWIFPNTITSELAGATISKIRVYLYANHWYYNGGGTALIKVHGFTAYPSTLSSMTTAATSTEWPKPGGRWVTLPSSLHAGFLGGTYKGIGVGPAGTQNLTYYGRFNRDGAKIEITYVK